jgi:rhodanese-related sulfurtransferase
MAITLEEMLTAARKAVPRIAPDDAMRLLESGGAIALDVRDKVEIRETGKIKGAVNVPRSRLEFKADPASPFYNAALTKDKKIFVYCK